MIDPVEPIEIEQPSIELPLVEQRYIVFNGALLAGVTKTDALTRLQLLTGLDEDDLIEELFSVKPVILKEAANLELAQHFIASFEQAGLQVELQTPSESLQQVINIDLPFSFSHEPTSTSVTESNLEKISRAIQSDCSEQQTGNPSQKTDKSTPTFRLVFDGDCNEDLTLEKTFDNLQHLTGSSREQVQAALFSVKPLVIIESDNPEEIKEYQQAYQRAGLKIRRERLRRTSPELFVSTLRIRRDKPRTNNQIKSHLSTLSILFFVALASAGWIKMKSQWVGPFNATPPPKIIVVTIGPQAIEAPAVIPTLAPKAAPIPSNEMAASPEPTPIIKQAKPQSAVPKKPVRQQPLQTKTPSKRAPTTREAYSNQLRLWLAKKQNSAASHIQQGMEGKVKLLLQLNRNGVLTNAKVVSGTGSTELNKIALDDAHGASPYPKIPPHLPEKTYQLKVTIRYQPTDQN